MVLEVRTVVTFGEEGGLVGGEGHKVEVTSEVLIGSVLLLHLGGGNTSVFTLVIIELCT